jgi:hypothetical protein
LGLTTALVRDFRGPSVGCHLKVCPAWIVRFDGRTVGGGKDAEWIEVVTPPGHLATLDGDDRDVSVAVGVTGGDDLPLGGVFQHDC